jgi:hypothetical protein
MGHLFKNVLVGHKNSLSNRFVSTISSGFESGTFQLVAQHLNHLQFFKNFAPALHGFQTYVETFGTN